MKESIPQEYSDVIDLSLHTIHKNKQALVFVNSKRSAEKQAEEVGKRAGIDSEELRQLSDEILNVLSTPTKQCKRLSECVKHGVAFHHAGLNQKQKELIENNFREGNLKIICCTPTLAAGVDLPAYRTIIRDVKRYTPRGMQDISVLEYLQIAGRAGRPKFDKEGQAICIAKNENEKEEMIEKYVNGLPEEIYSKLAAEPVLRTYVLSLIVSRVVSNKEQLMSFFEKTFFAYQFKDMEEIERLVTKVVEMLSDWEFIKTGNEEEDFVSADQLSSKYSPTQLGKRVSELYLDPYTANKLIEGMKREMEKNTFSYLQLISNTLEMRPSLRIKNNEVNDYEEKLTMNEDYLLEMKSYYDIEFEDFLNSIKTASFLESWIDEKTEEQLLEKYDIRPGEIKIKTDIADWLLFSCEELAKVLMLNEERKNITKIRQRVIHGIKEELLPLVRIKNIGRSRARKLYRNNIKDVGGLKRTDLSTLKMLIGNKTAEKIKEDLQKG